MSKNVELCQEYSKKERIQQMAPILPYEKNSGKNSDE